MANGIAGDFLKLFFEELSGRINERGGAFKAGIVSGEFSIGMDESFPYGKSGHGKYSSIDPGKMSPLFTYNDSAPFLNDQISPYVLRAANGGVLLIIFDRSVFFDDESVQKIAYTVMDMIIHGGHAVQIEIVDKAELRDAIANPQDHQDLIVRFWSAGVHFTRLDGRLQEYIISRAELAI